jgi:MFS family permease
VPDRDLQHPLQAAEDALEEVIGGPARMHVVLVLACVLALNTADQATVGAAGSQLESGLGIGNTALGVLAAVSPLMGAVAAFPAGALVDRGRRTRILAGGVLLWSAAMLLSAFAVSFWMLLVTRIALGFVVAVAAPAVASLTGDFFPADERGRIYGFVLAGELLGAAFGFVITGELAGVAGWRWALGALALPGIALSVWIVRTLPEPARGGQSRLDSGDTEIVAAEDVDPIAEAETDSPERVDELAGDEVRRQHVRARQDHVLRRDPASLSPWQAVRYVLSIPTNVPLIIAASLGYFFLEGLETFAVIFLERRYGIAHGLATLLLAVLVIVAIAGAVLGGRIGDRLIAHGHIAGRITVAAIAYGVAAVALAPAFALHALALALIFYLIGGLAIAAPNPPINAARLDIMPAALWGRAEGVRSVVQNLAMGLAPFLFGLVSDRLATGGNPGQSTGFGANGTGTGLRDTFLIMLIPLLVAAVLMSIARRRYPRDVATALASETALRAHRTTPCDPAG